MSCKSRVGRFMSVNYGNRFGGAWSGRSDLWSHYEYWIIHLGGVGSGLRPMNANGARRPRANCHRHVPPPITSLSHWAVRPHFSSGENDVLMSREFLLRLSTFFPVKFGTGRILAEMLTCGFKYWPSQRPRCLAKKGGSTKQTALTGMVSCGGATPWSCWRRGEAWRPKYFELK